MLNLSRSKSNMRSNFPTRDRSCTDILCALIFIIFYIFSAGISFYGLSKGNTRNIFQPYDGAGNACGKGSAQNFPYLYWTDIYQTSLTKNTVCVKLCPKVDKEKV